MSVTLWVKNVYLFSRGGLGYGVWGSVGGGEGEIREVGEAEKGLFLKTEDRPLTIFTIRRISCKKKKPLKSSPQQNYTTT